ncbi:MAG: metallophosphoesterase family protein [Lachnospiraceae bacterium]|nr:metallophosphoesterase family protein [Lachnospiraceae bacterium]
MTKQIGVIADIHSNFTAFKTAVKYMEAQGITEFFFLGDYVSDTTDTAETMDYIYKLMDRYTVTALRGNREDYMIGQRKVVRGESDGPKWIYNSASGNLLYTYERLTDRDLDFFESLPITFKYECEGYPALTCCHGSPENTRELLQFDGDNTREWLGKIYTDYLIAGHTHYQGRLDHNGRHYFNTGALGIAINNPGLAQCLILHGYDNTEAGGARWEAEFLSLPYDVDYVIDSIYEKGLMDKGLWFISNNIFTLKTGEDYTPELVNTAHDLQAKATGVPVNWPHIDEKYFAEAAAILGIPDYNTRK